MTAAATIGCDMRAGDNAADTGVARIAMSQAPTNVKCIRLGGMGTRAVTSSTTVTGGQATGAVMSLAGLPLGSMTPADITTGPDGNVWFAESPRVGRLTP
jgi:hypothetical protein